MYIILQAAIKPKTHIGDNNSTKATYRTKTNKYLYLKSITQNNFFSEFKGMLRTNPQWLDHFKYFKSLT